MVSAGDVGVKHIPGRLGLTGIPSGSTVAPAYV